MDLAALFDDVLEAGENADESRCDISAEDHDAVMLSGNLESSITRMSVAERRPSILADAASSSLRTWPNPSAFPTQYSHEENDRD